MKKQQNDKQKSTLSNAKTALAIRKKTLFKNKIKKIKKMKRQEEVLKITADLWNSFLEIPKEQTHPDDINDFKFHLHAIQSIIFTQLYKLKEKENMQKQKVFIVQHVRNMMLMGCFKTKQDAETYTNKSKDFFIIESEIQEYEK